MTATFPDKLAAVSAYAAVICAPTLSEKQDGITLKIRVVMTGKSGGEMTVAVKKVPSQKASLKVRSLNGQPFYGLTRRAGEVDPDLLARSAIILQMMASETSRPFTIPVERYCDAASLKRQEKLLLTENLRLQELAKQDDGSIILKKLGVQKSMFKAGIVFRNSLPDLQAVSIPFSSPVPTLSVPETDDEFWGTFRKNLKTHVDASPLIQTKLDLHIGAYRGYLSHLKCGKSFRVPSREQLLELSKSLDILPSDLHSRFADLDASLIDRISADPDPEKVIGERTSKATPPTPETVAPDPEPDTVEDPVVTEILVTQGPAVETAQEVSSDPHTPENETCRSDIKPDLGGGLFDVKMSSASRPSRVRITVEAEIPYLIGKQVLDLLHEAALAS
jgi:hypothetical protein